MRYLAILGLLAALAGCAGTRFSYESARKVQVGMTEAQVTQIMGRPYSVTTKGGEQVWVWSWANGFSGNARAVSFKLEGGRVTEVPDIPDSFTPGKRTVLAAAPAHDTSPTPPAPTDQPMTEAAYKQEQLKKLMDENLPYDEYQKRYKAIMSN